MRLHANRPASSEKRGAVSRLSRPFVVPEREAPRADPATRLENARRYGHHLGTFGVSVARPASAPAPAVTPAPVWMGPSMPSAPIQRVPLWKKALYGLGGVAGTVATGVGALGLAGLTTAVSPLVAGGLLAGGAGLAAYSAYKASNIAADDKKAVSGAVSEARSTHSDLDARRKKDQLTGREDLLHGLLSETLPYLDTGQAGVEPTTGRSELALPAPPEGDLQERNDPRNRRYGVRLNPDQSHLPTQVLHELIHASADQKYRGNRTVYEDRSSQDRLMPFNVDSEDSEELPKAAEKLEGKVRKVMGVVAEDRDLSTSQRKYLTERLQYAATSSESEYDSVMSELVYYLHQTGIQESSATSRAIEAAAREAQQLRNSG
jgi:hypothetical protein